MTKPTRTLFAWLLALSLLGGWTVQAATSCGGTCCASEMAAPGPMGHGGVMAEPMASGCCCGDEAAPCELEQGDLSDPPPRALASVPRVEPPAAGILVEESRHRVPNPLAAGVKRSSADPPGRAPPDPLYLHNLSLLC